MTLMQLKKIVTEEEIIQATLVWCVGKRLTYKRLIANPKEAA